jgi:pimeloyl-ACP methyl ester carboxylesterase
LNSTEWYYLKQQLADHFRVIVWDLPGLGLSMQPVNHDHSLENMARGLEAVLRLTDNQPTLLLGHSIGGMIILTFCRLFPEALGTRVAGLALVHTTYMNPVRTAKYARLLAALERPLMRPLLHLNIWLWPLVWLMNVLGYLNGTMHLITKATAFAGTETWEQLDFTARFQPKASPAVSARGMFGMLAYDASATLPTIPVPTLVVAADRDPLCVPAASEYIRQAVPSAQRVDLAPARHMGLLEHHRHFAKIVRTFASSCLPTVGLSNATQHAEPILLIEPTAVR